MRRHCHLLISQSTIKDAGWGVFTKHDLKSGDFVHEYVGEMISQEEAERRGVVYDKINRSFLFNLCSDVVLDASKKGSFGNRSLLIYAEAIACTHRTLLEFVRKQNKIH